MNERQELAFWEWYDKLEPDAQSAVKRQLKQAEKTPGHVTGVLGSIGQGLSFGFADELAGVVGGVLGAAQGFPFGEAYAGTRDAARERHRLYSEANPVISTGAEVGGGLLTGGWGGAKALGSQALSKLSPLAKYAAVGGGEGALAGAGTSEASPIEKPVHFGYDVATGGAAGAALGGALGKVGDVVTDRFASAKSAAGRRLEDAMRADGLNLGEVAIELQRLGPEATLADVSDSFKARARAVAYTDEGRKKVREVLETRQKGQQARIETALHETTGADTGFYRQMQEAMSGRAKRAEPLYNRAHKAEVDVDPWMRGLVEDQDLKGIRARADRLYRLKTGRDPVPGDLDRLQYWDYYKQSLDDEVSSAFRTGEGNLGTALKEIRDRLRGYLDEQVPDYAKARAVYAGDTAVMNAMQLGRSVLRQDAEEMAAALKRMDTSEREAFIAGAAKAIRDKVMMGPESANQARNLIKSPGFRERMRNAFPSEEAFETFVQRMDAEMQMGQTYSDILQGSKTAPVQAEQSALGGERMSDALRELAKGNVAGATTSGLRAAANRLESRRVKPAVAREMSNVLFAPGPAQSMGRLWEATAPAQMSPRVVPGLIGAGAVPATRPEEQYVMVNGRPVSLRRAAEMWDVTRPGSLLGQRPGANWELPPQPLLQPGGWR